jgi:dihydrolipoamide dehydrogenase
MGTEVTVIEFADKVTPSMDGDVCKTFKKILEKSGFKFHLSHKVTGVKRNGQSAKVDFEAIKDGVSKNVTADCVLVAVGRRPFVSGLGIENVGVKLNDRGFVEINGSFQTNVSNIYAIGDVVPGPMLAHKAEEDGIAAAETIAGIKAHVDYNLVPGVIYTHPEIANIGKTEDELKSAGVAYNVGKFSMMANSRARANDDSEGFVKILACKTTDRVLGCHIIGAGAGDIIHEIAAVMTYKGSSEDIALICHAHPTVSEAVKEASMDVLGRVIHS